MTRVVYESYVHAVRGNQINVGGKVLNLAPEARISLDPRGQMAVNQRVQVSGRVDAKQGVTVDRVLVRSGPSDLGRTRVSRSNDDRTGDDTATSKQEAEDDSKSGKSDDGDDDSKDTSGSSSDDSKSDSDSDSDDNKSGSSSGLSSSSDDSEKSSKSSS